MRSFDDDVSTTSASPSGAEPAPGGSVRNQSSWNRGFDLLGPAGENDGGTSPKWRRAKSMGAPESWSSAAAAAVKAAASSAIWPSLPSQAPAAPVPGAGRRPALRLRGGADFGPAVAGVLGTSSLRYCLLGPSREGAGRLEQASQPGRILVSAAMARLLQSGSRTTRAAFALEEAERVLPAAGPPGAQEPQQAFWLSWAGGVRDAEGPALLTRAGLRAAREAERMSGVERLLNAAAAVAGKPSQASFNS